MRFPLRFWNTLGGILTTAVALLVVLYPDKVKPEVAAAIIALGNAIIVTLITLVSEGTTTPLADVRLAAGTSYKVTDPADSQSVLGVRTVPTP